MDIYFEPDYGKLYENIENGKSVSWIYKGAEGTISHLFLLRKLPMEMDGAGMYDIVTPYGYGGPVIREVKTTKEDLTAAFEREFRRYCREKQIVSEFVRFHPIIGNGVDFQKVYGSQCIRKTVGTNLKDYDDPVASEFSRSCRKNIRQAMKKGITFRITERPENVDGFLDIYYATMERNHASDYFYFEKSYFEELLRSFRNNILYVEAVFEEKVIAAGINFTSGKLIHIHLSGAYAEYLFLSPERILQYAATIWGKEKGYEMIHHGGGRSNAKDDGLFTFKKEFGRNTLFDFYEGKRIWDEEAYQKAVRIREKEHGRKIETEFFPQYRADMKI